ncbi:MAG TPA: exo-alpha-sialidase, partial [Paludibacteraceae bacterium]|nr:exo-alpha-sialidase [Paludibacteraceae bacterium]HRS24447.1 exo-alpha-sialidase [Paludibacteraceae bacterium]
MQYFKELAICISVLLCFSCQKNNEIAAKSPSLSIRWDESSLVCIAAEGGYPRVKRLNDGSLLAAYEN